MLKHLYGFKIRIVLMVGYLSLPLCLHTVNATNQEATEEEEEHGGHFNANNSTMVCLLSVIVHVVVHSC